MNVRNRAFTLVELLVVIAIISMLVVLLLPAIQAIRESARRTMCLNNLTQLVVAVHSYELAHEVYPPGVIDKSGPIDNTANGYHHNWIVQILPYLEETNVYKHINPQVSVYHKDHATVRQLVLSPLVCPSEWGGFVKFATSSYAACHHDVEAPIDTDNNGVFFLNSRIGRDDVSDGLAYTIFLGEKTAEDLDRGWMSGTRATLRNTGTPLNMTGANAAGRFVPLGSPPATVIDYGGYGETPRPADGAASDTPAEKSGDPPAADVASVPDTQSEDNGSESEELTEPEARDGEGPAASGDRAGSRSASLYVGGFGSHHPAGANMAFGDGVVKFMPEAINPRVYQQLGHRADGQLLSTDQFR